MSDLLQQYNRVTRSDRCIICGHDSWCLNGKDGVSAICTRTESPKRWGDAGYYHGPARASTGNFERSGIVDVSGNNYPTMSLEGQTERRRVRLEWLATNLGVSVAALDRLGVRHWPSLDYLGNSITEEQREAMFAAHPENGEFLFPMRHPTNRIIGWRTRSPAGEKRSVTGSRNGLFIPSGLDVHGKRLYLCEGPTDCAAGLDLGMDIIGRPDATSGVEFIKNFLMRFRPRELILIADRDASGIGLKGAWTLKKQTTRLCRTSIVLPPTKDLRDYVRSGGTRSELETWAVQTRRNGDASCQNQ